MPTLLFNDRKRHVISIVDSNMTALLSLALDAATMRQQAIAQNIANVNTPGYRRVGVSFESRLASLATDLPRGAILSLADLSNVRPTLDYAGGAVQLDQELTDMSETVLHHQALLKVLGRQLELIGLAINEGKR
jgi:flagellar basal-body rod protein FlgB